MQHANRNIDIYFSGQQDPATLTGKVDLFFKHYKVHLQGENELQIYDMQNGDGLTTVIAPRSNRIVKVTKLNPEDPTALRAYSEGVLEATIRTEKSVEKYRVILS